MHWDFPLEYADFEGVVPEGQYGAGSVIVWDSGTYRNLATDDAGTRSRSATRSPTGTCGWLDGQKLSEGYALTKMAGGRKEWLLKMDDEQVDRRRKPTKTQPESVLSGRTVDEIAEESGGS